MTYTNPYKSKYTKPNRITPAKSTLPIISSAVPIPPSLPKVDKNIPIPPSRSGLSRYHFYLLKEPNDSIFYPAITPTDRHRIMSSAITYSKRHNCKLIARSVTENNIKGIRVWKAT